MSFLQAQSWRGWVVMAVCAGGEVSKNVSKNVGFCLTSRKRALHNGRRIAKFYISGAMDRQTKAFFDALHNDRAEDAKVFAKPAYRKFWAQIVEKYSDRAHYVYELIQNADDAGATEARFVLEPDRLIFAHNGPRHFSISNPATEEADEASGRLGDLNSITGISFSNKDTQVENKIGGLLISGC